MSKQDDEKLLIAKVRARMLGEVYPCPKCGCSKVTNDWTGKNGVRVNCRRFKKLNVILAPKWCRLLV